MKGLFSYLFTPLLVLALVIPGTFLLSPSEARAFGGLGENGTAAFMGIGVNPTKILHVSGSGPGTVPLFVRGTDSAGFIIERTPTNRWVFGVNESAGLGNGFVLSTFPAGSGSSVARLLVTPQGRVLINTLSPSSYSPMLQVESGDTTFQASAIYGKSTTSENDTWGVWGEHGEGNHGALGGLNYGVMGVYNYPPNRGYLGSSSAGVYGYGENGIGVKGESEEHAGVHGYSLHDIGVYGKSDNASSYAGYFEGPSSYGYLGGDNYAVYGRNGDSGPWGHLGSSGEGAMGISTIGNYGRLGTEIAGVYAWGHSTGNTNTAVKASNGSSFEAKLCTMTAAVYGQAPNSASWAGDFWGCVRVMDNLTVADNLTVGARAGIGTTSAANSTLQVQGSFSTAFRLVDAHDNINEADSVIAVDAGEDDVFVTLPTAAGCKGRVYTVKKVDSAATEVIVETSGAEKIDADDDYVLNEQWEMVTIVSDGSNWLIISKYNPPSL